MGLSASPPQSAPVHILLVNDTNGLNARRTVLTELGYQVTAVTNMLEAHATLSEHDVQLIVTDHKPPEIDALTFISAVRRVRPELPVILLSGLAEPLGLSEANTGATIVIQKSATEVNHLTRAVQRLLKRKKPPGSSPSSHRLRRYGV